MPEVRRLKLGGGRSGMKEEVRQQLTDAALELIDAGREITIAKAARRAGLSAGTAYRYFSDASTLIMEACIARRKTLRSDLFNELEARLAQVCDIEERVLIVHRMLFDLVCCNERASRLYMAKVHECRASRNYEDVASQPAKRVKMYEMALSPLKDRIGARAVSDLVSSLSVASGFESYTVLKDLRRHNCGEIERITRSNILAILRAALAPAA